MRINLNTASGRTDSKFQTQSIFFAYVSQNKRKRYHHILVISCPYNHSPSQLSQKFLQIQVSLGSGTCQIFISTCPPSVDCHPSAGHNFTAPSSPQDATAGSPAVGTTVASFLVKSCRTSKQRTPRVWCPGKR